jgi:hypothetical protein
LGFITTTGIRYNKGLVRGGVWVLSLKATTGIRYNKGLVRGGVWVL